jgi:hypothetical protein
MIKKATIIKKSEDRTRAIAIDDDAVEEILRYIQQDRRHLEKFNDITNLILNGLKNTNLYDKEEPDSQSKGVRAMKFFKGQENDRIYCREVTTPDKIFVVITSELLLKKKNNKLKSRERNIIRKVASYEYEEIKDPEGKGSF